MDQPHALALDPSEDARKLRAMIEDAAQLAARAARAGEEEPTGLLYLGNPQTPIPDQLLLDPDYDCETKILWSLMRLKVHNSGQAALAPSHAELTRLLRISMTALEEKIGILRRGRWLTRCVDVNTQGTGVYDARVYALHDKPLSLTDTIYLDPDYFYWANVSQSELESEFAPENNTVPIPAAASMVNIWETATPDRDKGKRETLEIRYPKPENIELTYPSCLTDKEKTMAAALLRGLPPQEQQYLLDYLKDRVNDQNAREIKNRLAYLAALTEKHKGGKLGPSSYGIKAQPPAPLRTQDESESEEKTWICWARHLCKILPKSERDKKIQLALKNLAPATRKIVLETCSEYDNETKSK